MFSTPIHNKELNWLDLQDIRQLEGLVRAHVLLAMMVGEGSSQFTDHLVKAYYSLSRLLWQAVENGMYAIKEIGKLNVTSDVNPAGAEKAKKSLAPEVGGKKGVAVATGAGGKNSKNVKIETGASGYLPQSLEQWSVFEVSEEISNAW